jgi:predicted DNA-binding protein with PD1-like motif
VAQRWHLELNDRKIMKTKLLHEAEGQATYALILSAGDEVMSCLKAFAEEKGLSAASFKAIGAFERAELSFFDWGSKDYTSIPVPEQVEVASLTGDIALTPDGKPAVHVHAVLSRKDGSAVAGHLNSGLVRPTLEIILTESPKHLRKRVDPKSGLMLIALDN